MSAAMARTVAITEAKESKKNDVKERYGCTQSFREFQTHNHHD